MTTDNRRTLTNNDRSADRDPLIDSLMELWRSGGDAAVQLLDVDDNEVVAAPLERDYFNAYIDRRLLALRMRTATDAPVDDGDVDGELV